MLYYEDDEWQDGQYPAIMAVGDSWFWYPHNNILSAIIKNPGLLDGYKNIQALGHNGALLQDYVGAGKYASYVDNSLSVANHHYFNTFMISGAGNDAVQYGLALKPDCSAISNPKLCISPDYSGSTI